MSILQKLYGLDPHNVAPSKDAGFSNPDWSAGGSGDTVGGIGNKTGMGGDINWTNPTRQTAQPTSPTVQQYGYGADPDLQESNTLRTHKGDYQAVWHPNTGTWSLQTVPGTGGVNVVDNENKFYNLSHGDLHVGINPYTGEMWYQRATNLGDLPSGFGSGGMMAGTNADVSQGGGGNNTGAANQAESTANNVDQNATSETAMAAQQSIVPASSGYSAAAPMQLGYQAQPLSSLSASGNVDYAKLINSALAVDVLGGMLTGRGMG